MILTNILLAILVGFKIKKYLQNKLPFKFSKHYIQKEWVVEELKKLETALTMEMTNLDAHKVFTTKSLSELRDDLELALKPALENTTDLSKQNNKWKSLFNLAVKGVGKKVKTKKEARGIKSSKYTKFQLEKEVLRHLKNTGEAKGMGLKAIKDIKGLESKSYKRQISKAYSRLCQRKGYQLKMTREMKLRRKRN